MKRLFFLCLMVVVLLPSLSPAAISPARIRSTYGDISVRTPEDDEWLPAAANTPLDEGDSVWSPEGSRVEIQLPDGSVLRLDGGSQIDVLAIEEGFIHLHLDTGRLYLRTIQGMSDNSLQIDADDTTVLPAGRTRVRIDMLPNSLEDVAILKGTAYVEGNGGRTRVRAGEHIMLDERHSEIHPLNPADSWEIWNLDRDREQSRGARTDSYLPDELRPYASEMDTNGSWVPVPEYGMVWRPSVVVSADWAPYREGRWIWKGDDYVWISYETWGWVPYHYGRWTVIGTFGWCWIPPARGDVYWGPGYVGWYQTGDSVGWTPLAPGEIFYGRRNYGRYSVNITTVHVNTSTVVYRNRTHHGGLTVLPHNDFLYGRRGTPRAGVRMPDATTISAGSPRIKPLRETRMPVVKQTPPRQMPPNMERRDRRELRDKFPRVTPESGSRGQLQRGGTPPSSGQTPTRQGRDRNDTRIPDRSKERSNPVMPPSSQPGSKPRDDVRGGTGESRGFQGGKPAPQAEPPQRVKPAPWTKPPQEAKPAPQSQPPQGGKPVPQVQPPQRGESSPQQQSPRRGEERRDTSPATAPDVQKVKPAGAGSGPERSTRPAEERQRSVTPPSTGTQGQPVTVPPRSDERKNVPAAATPPRAERPQGGASAPATGSRSASPAQRTEQPRREPSDKETKPRQIWRVTTPEAAPAPGPAPSQDREGRGRERR